MNNHVLPRVQLGDPRLRKSSRLLKQAEISSSEIQNLITQMRFTLSKIKGVGLAAPQVGHNIQLSVINFKPDPERPEIDSTEHRTIINPTIKQSSKETAEIWEGCLSFPSVFAKVKRPSSVKVEYLNEKGEKCEETMGGFLARVVQHEVDHFSGVVWTDSEVDWSTLMTREEYLKRIRKA